MGSGAESVVEELESQPRLEFPDHQLEAAPVAGAGIVVKLDSTWRWRIVSARFTLTTSAVVADRVVSVDVADDEGTAWIRSLSPVAQVAGKADVAYDFVERADAIDLSADSRVQAGLPRVWIPGGWQLRVNVENIDAGDQLGELRLYVVKLLSNVG